MHSLLHQAGYTVQETLSMHVQTSSNRILLLLMGHVLYCQGVPSLFLSGLKIVSKSGDTFFNLEGQKRYFPAS